jgi:transposase
MIVIGVDTHKRSHALAAVDEGTGRVRGKRQITAQDAGHLAAVRWARELDSDRVWAIEDCRHVSRRLEQALIAAGERVIRVSPKLMGASRKGEREPGKSDEIDSRAIARAVAREGIGSFPVAYLDEQAMRIRLLCDHRQDLVAERTRMQTRLRWHLMDLCPEVEAKIKPRSLSRTSALDRLERQPRRLPTGERLRIAREELAHIRRLTRQIDALEQELEALVKAHRPWLLEETGCGPLVASVLIGHTAGAQRFRSGSAFARQAGACPIPCSSGQTKTYRLNRGGDRQLNSALHTIAASRARVDPTTKQYLARKQAEGKTKKGALRCLKRTLANHFHQLLARPPLNPAHAEPIPAKPSSQRETQPIHTAPNPTLCFT